MEKVTATWLGNASIKIETPQTKLLIDPYIEMPGGEHRNCLKDFLGVDAILVTHPHLDHLSSVPEILKRESPTVYCTEYSAKLITEAIGFHRNVKVINPGDSFSLTDINIKVYKSAHIHFDTKLILETMSIHNLKSNWSNALPLFKQNMHFKEHHETILFDINTNDKHIQVMGSLGLDENTDYPTGADYLFLPYQGNSNLLADAIPIINKLKPKHIILTHFDNAFPPISKTVWTGDIINVVQSKYDNMEITKPKFRKLIVL